MTTDPSHRPDVQTQDTPRTQHPRVTTLTKLPPAATATTPATPAPATGPTVANAPDTVRRSRTGGRVWAYLGIVLGAVVSVAANVAHSYVRPSDLTDSQAASSWTPETGAVIGATFWPIALLTTTEIMIRTSWPPGRAWLLLRFLGLLPVAGVAGIVSYLHLYGLLQHYHEAPLTCLIAPLSVDGLMVMASSALLASNTTDQTTCGHLPPASTPPDNPGRTTPAPSAPADAGDPFRLRGHCLPEANGHRPDTATSPPADTSAPPPDVRTPGPGRARVSTAAAVARLLQVDPDLATADIAGRLGVTARTVRRHLAKHRDATDPGGDAPPARDGGATTAADPTVVRPQPPRTT